MDQETLSVYNRRETVCDYEVGDLLEIQRETHSHELVYCGNDEVIHMTGDGYPDSDALAANSSSVFTIGDIGYKKAVIRKDKLQDVVENGTVKKNNKLDSTHSVLSPEQIVRRANDTIGPVVDPVLWNNCKDFAYWCRYGVSNQSASGDDMAQQTVEIYYEDRRISVDDLEKGDLLEIKRQGYSHWVVYIGEQNVIHLTGQSHRCISGSIPHSSGVQNEMAYIKEDNLQAVAQGSKVIKNNQHDSDPTQKCFSPEEISDRAKGEIGPAKYNLFTNNCEHFANWCRYDAEKSKQANDLLDGIGKTVFAIASFVFAVGFIAFGRK